MNIYCFSTLSFAKLQFKSVINKAFHKHGVASFTDAWIETKECAEEPYRKTVASFTDAWIETEETRHQYQRPKVASFTDAWIETISVFCDEESIVSHLLQMRGLKPDNPVKVVMYALSHLLQMRGLKQRKAMVRDIYISRIFYRCVD